MKLIRFLIVFSFAFCLNFVFATAEFSAQTKGAAAKKPAVEKTAAIPAADLPKVNQVDEVALLNLLKRDGENTKPLLVNFWATWCGPCVEEFPDLVKINNDYQGKIDFITVTLDDLAEINTSVPQFLAKMKATMPTYLLKTTDENSAIESVSKDWQGGLPFTILYDGKGATVYSKQAKFAPAQLRAEIDGVLAKSRNLVISETFEKGKVDALRDTLEGKLSYKIFNDSLMGYRDLEAFQVNYGIDVQLLNDSLGWIYVKRNTEPYKKSPYYAKGYNSVSEPEIEKKHGKEVLEKLKKLPTNYPADVTELTLTKKIN